MYISLALCCVVPEGFHTSVKPEKRLSSTHLCMTAVWCRRLSLDVYSLWEVYGRGGSKKNERGGLVERGEAPYEGGRATQGVGTGGGASSSRLSRGDIF